jgi:hypothetical protein
LNENAEQLLFDVAAAVPALINDHRLLVSILAQFLLKLAKARLVHRLYVQVTDAPVREFRHQLAPLFDPTLVA